MPEERTIEVTWEWVWKGRKVCRKETIEKGGMGWVEDELTTLTDRVSSDTQTKDNNKFDSRA